MSTTVLPAHRALAATAQRMTENWLRNVFCTGGHEVRGREADDGTPDIAVFRTNPPTDADRVPVLVVAVEDADSAYDADELASARAAEGVPDFWVIDVVARSLRVFRDPRPDPDAPHGFSYKQVRACSPFALVAPLAAELHLAQVINLLP